MKPYCTIVGAGIIGSAIAYEFARRGIKDVHVIDADLEGELSSTERNAGGVRHLWQHPINVELAKASIQLFRKIKEAIGFQQSGYLWLMSKEKTELGHKLLKEAQTKGLAYEKWNVNTIQSRYPFIDKTNDLDFAIFGAQDGLINSNALKNYYRDEAKKGGIQFHNHHRLLSLSENTSSKVQLSLQLLDSTEQAHQVLKDPQFNIQSNQVTWESEIVILCAGAWTYALIEGSAPKPKLKPLRRQISYFKAEAFDMSPYGMVVDTSRVYFHPEGGNILAGIVLKEEEPGFNFEYDPDFFENHIWPALYERSSKFEKLKHQSGWGGLYSYTPDTTGILGKVPSSNNIYEAHSFTGRGVMQSYGAAKAICESILDGKYTSFDATPLGRDRFFQGNLLNETLHI